MVHLIKRYIKALQKNYLEYKIKESKPNQSLDTESIISPTETQSSVETKATTISSGDSPDYTKDRFTPRTLGELDKVIEENTSNLKAIDNLPIDDTTKPSIKEKLIDEKRYLLDQKAKHVNSVLQQAKNTNLHDVDVDNLRKQVSQLKTTVDDLMNQSEDLKTRSLNESKEM